MRAMQVCVNNTRIYASKLMNDHPSAVEFKNAKTLATLQKMLTAMAVPVGPQTAQDGRRNRAAVDELIDPSAGRIAVNTARLEQTSSPREGLVNPSEECASPASRINKSIEGSSAINHQLMDMVIMLQEQMQTLQQRQNERNEQGGIQVVEKMGKGKGKGNAKGKGKGKGLKVTEKEIEERERDVSLAKEKSGNRKRTHSMVVDEELINEGASSSKDCSIAVDVAHVEEAKKNKKRKRKSLEDAGK